MQTNLDSPVTRDSKSFAFSTHAKQRLVPRAKISEQDLLRMLNAKAYKKIHAEFETDVPRSDIDEYVRRYGMTFWEMKKIGMINLTSVIEHQLVWSEVDQKPLTLIVANESKTVITVLLAEEYLSHDWSDKVTVENVNQAKQKAHDLLRRMQYEILLRWISLGQKSKFKVIKSVDGKDVTKITQSEIECYVRERFSGRAFRAVIRNRKNPEEVVQEFSFD